MTRFRKDKQLDILLNQLDIQLLVNLKKQLNLQLYEQLEIQLEIQLMPTMYHQGIMSNMNKLLAQL